MCWLLHWVSVFFSNWPSPSAIHHNAPAQCQLWPPWGLTLLTFSLLSKTHAMASLWVPFHSHHSSTGFVEFILSSMCLLPSRHQSYSTQVCVTSFSFCRSLPESFPSEPFPLCLSSCPASFIVLGYQHSAMGDVNNCTSSSIFRTEFPVYPLHFQFYSFLQTHAFLYFTSCL